MTDKTLHRDRAIKLALTAVMAAVIEVGKLALAYIPNVEVVTLLCAVFGFVFGWTGIAATYIFILLECFVWGFNTWVLTYVIYWPIVTFVFMLLGRRNCDNRFIATLAAVTLTAFFGVLSSLVDTGLLTGFWDRFWYRFSIIYVRGISFYITQIVCNLLLFLIVFKPLVNFVDKICPSRFKSLKMRKKVKLGAPLDSDNLSENQTSLYHKNLSQSKNNTFESHSPDKARSVQNSSQKDDCNSIDGKHD